MKRVIVIGSGGAGKSMFSRQLGEITGLPVVHLDALFWKPNWVGTPGDEWTEVVRREIEKPEWIMDGNFGGTRAMRMEAADTIIMLDLPRWLCMYSIFKRLAMFYNKKRPDMGEGCSEKIDAEFIMWVWNYKTRSRARTLEELKLQTKKTVVILQKRREVADFLDKMRLESQ